MCNHTVHMYHAYLGQDQAVGEVGYGCCLLCQCISHGKDAPFLPVREISSLTQTHPPLPQHVYAWPSFSMLHTEKREILVLESREKRCDDVIQHSQKVALKHWLFSLTAGIYFMPLWSLQ